MSKGSRWTEEQLRVLQQRGMISPDALKPDAPPPAAVPEPKVKASKFKNVKTVVDGITFDSKKEAKRWEDLCMLEQAGDIRDLRRQVDFGLSVNGEHICVYRADFVYIDDSGKRVVEDAKGMKTDVYLIKKKLMLACYGITIKET